MTKFRTSKDLALKICKLAGDKKGTNIKVIHVGDVLYITDYFVIVSGGTDKHIRAILDHVTSELLKDRIKPLGIEGERECLWILEDYGDVVLHIMQENIREYYQLERLWSDADIIDFDESAANL